MHRSFTFGIVAFIFLTAFSLQLISFTGGPPAGRTGAPGESTCNSAGCHNSFALNSGSGTPLISSNVPQEGYNPGETYTLTYKIKQNGIGKFGFESMVYSPISMSSAGVLSLTDQDNTQLTSAGSREYVQHTALGTAATDSQMWSVDWIAPESGSGEVEVYAAFNAANGANGNQGDLIYTRDISIPENTVTSVQKDLLRNKLRWYVNQESLNIQLELTRPGDLSWSLIDLQGRKVREGFAYATGNSYLSRIVTADFSPGVYILKISAPGELLSQKIIIR